MMNDYDLMTDEEDVLDLFDPNQAAAAAATSMTDQGSGQWRVDD